MHRHVLQTLLHAHVLMYVQYVRVFGCMQRMGYFVMPKQSCSKQKKCSHIISSFCSSPEPLPSLKKTTLAAGFTLRTSLKGSIILDVFFFFLNLKTL